jgi:hypothetical protein
MTFMKRTYPPIIIKVAAVLLVSLLTAAFFYVYWNYPFSGHWNDTLLYFSFPLVAFLTAGVATLNSLRFKKGELPRKVWTNLALALWCWMAGELIWAILAIFMEVPEVSLADIPWVGAYYFFAKGFMQQFRIISQPTPAQERKWIGIAVSATLIGTFVVTMVTMAAFSTEQTWFETYLSIFYVFADLTLAVAALKIARTFGRGIFGHAWIGLLAIGLSDVTYSVLYLTGLYEQSAESDSILSMIADGLYLDAYLITALMLLTNLLLLYYGPRPTQARELRLNAS